MGGDLIQLAVFQSKKFNFTHFYTGNFMIRIIDGVRYNTKKADQIAHFRNHFGTQDFQWYEEFLHVSNSGSFFLYGEGNAMSKYKEFYQNTYIGSSKIIPLTKEKALSWCEKDGVKILDYFLFEIHFNEMITEA